MRAKLFVVALSAHSNSRIVLVELGLHQMESVMGLPVIGVVVVRKKLDVVNPVTAMFVPPDKETGTQRPAQLSTYPTTGCHLRKDRAISHRTRQVG